MSEPHNEPPVPLSPRQPEPTPRVPGRPAHAGPERGFYIDPADFPRAPMTNDQIKAEIAAAPDADLGDLAAELLTAIAEGTSGKVRLALLLCARILRAVL